MDSFHNNTWYLFRESIIHGDGTTLAGQPVLGFYMCIAPVVSPLFRITTPGTHTILISALNFNPSLPISCYGDLLLTCLTFTQTLVSALLQQLFL